MRDLGATPFSGDLFSADLASGMQECDVLIHAAADTDHGPGTERQERVNQDGTEAVFRAARAAGVSRAVHLSTESVLADGRPLINVDEHHPFPRRPAGAYSRTKAAAERCALSYNGAPCRSLWFGHALSGGATTRQLLPGSARSRSVGTIRLDQRRRLSDIDHPYRQISVTASNWRSPGAGRRSLLSCRR